MRSARLVLLLGSIGICPGLLAQNVLPDQGAPALRRPLAGFLHADADLDESAAEARELGGDVVALAPDVPSLTAAFALAGLDATLEKLARLDLAQAVDAVSPPLEGANDGAHKNCFPCTQLGNYGGTSIGIHSLRRSPYQEDTCNDLSKLLRP